MTESPAPSEAPDEVERRALTAALRATRQILRARDGRTAQRALVDLTRALGAGVAPAEDNPPDAVPIDLSLGESDPLLPVTADPQVRLLLNRFLVPAVSDARTVVDRGVRADILTENATLDALTGLWSRRPLTQAINGAAVGDALALLDLDHFKRVNDTLGHDAGDEVLKAFAAHLRAEVRDRDIVGRLGGEEFVLLLPGTTLDDAVAVLRRVRETWPAASPQHVTFSAGVVSVVQPPDPHELPGQHALKRADAVMYRAKDSGRDVIQWQ
ncbi:MAG: GGDEF domain-containing protein [Candidatus Nanopelagicales bacterium]